MTLLSTTVEDGILRNTIYNFPTDTAIKILQFPMNWTKNGDKLWWSRTKDITNTVKGEYYIERSKELEVLNCGTGYGTCLVIYGEILTWS